MSIKEKLNWIICRENQKKVDTYTFPLTSKPIPTEPCSHCKGTGYKRQNPREYGLCECTFCNGSGKQIKRIK